MKLITLSARMPLSLKRAKPFMKRLKRMSYEEMINKLQFYNSKIARILTNQFTGWKKQYPELYFVDSNWIDVAHVRKKVKFQSKSRVSILRKQTVNVKFKAYIKEEEKKDGK